MRRNDLLKMYEVEDYQSGRGKHRRRSVYVGPKYAYDRALQQSLRVKCAVLAALSLLLFVAAGFIPYCTCQIIVWVVVPYVVTLLPLVYTIGSAWTLYRMKDPATEPERVDGVQRMRMSSVCLAILGIVWTGTAAAHCLINSRNILFWLSEAAFMACGAGSAVCGFLLYRLIRKLNMKMIDEPQKGADDHE